MKRTIKILSLVLVFIMCFGVINAFAKGKTLSNDKFYAVIPEGFKIIDDYGDDHYYFEGPSSSDYEKNYTTTIYNLEILVEANILFPDGIKDTDIGIIKDRFKKYISVEESCELEIKKAEKGNINGITACYIYGTTDDGISEEFLHAYILTTKENLYIVATSNFIDSYENEPEFLKEFISNFLVNGTYYNGEKLSETKAYDFSKAEKYIDALERDVLTENYYSYHSGTAGIGLMLLLIGLCLPIISIVFLILYIKTKKKLKEYKEFFGSIEQARVAMRQHYMENSSYQPTQNNGGFYTNVPNMNAYNSNQQPISQPGYQQYQPTQPAQQNLPPEMQEFQNSNENKF